MRSPEQIARSTFDRLHSQSAEECESEILALIAEGIEADRAERTPPVGTITIHLDSERTPLETLEEVARQIAAGFTRGYHPGWEITR